MNYIGVLLTGGLVAPWDRLSWLTLGSGDCIKEFD